MEGKSMNYAVYNIALDIHKTGTQVALSMTRGENKRKIVISLMENGRPYKITDGCTAMFSATKPDGKFVYNDCEIDFENNLIIYTVTSQTTAAMGEVKCQIELIGSDGGVLFSPTFSLIVANKLYNQEPILASSEEFNALTVFLADLQKKLADGEFKGDRGDQGDTGAPGTSVTVASVTESTTDGGSNVVKFSDGKSVTIKNGSKGSTGAAGKDADVSSLSPAIVCTSTGTTIAVSDSSESGFEALSIYGKSTQNGTPTPDAPIDIVSLGSDGSIVPYVFKKNICDATLSASAINFGGLVFSKDLLAIKKDNTYTISVELTASAKTKAYWNPSSGVYNWKEFEISAGTNRYYFTFVALHDGGSASVTLLTKSDTSDSITITPAKVQIELGSSMTPYEVFNKQSMSIPLSTPLRAIPVTDSSLATYTDANGQMWCADEIDLERGVYVQRLLKLELTGAEEWGNTSDNEFRANITATLPNTSFDGVWCTHYRQADNGVRNVHGTIIRGISGYQIFICDNTFGNDVAAFTSALAEKYKNGNPITIYCRRATPIETPLTSEQIAAYKALKTNYPTTTVLNDENAFMKVGYRADTKNFIKRMAGSTTQISSVTLPASKWVGSASPYSQVVTIARTTKNSKIDLNPTVDQLNIFHNKDIAFVVGNNNGVTTVYCIGQKPTNDYTMQVTITEVANNE